MINKSAIDIAYAFLHQKLQVYMYSTMAWQRDDIELAIGDYVQQMNSELYDALSQGRQDFLLSHERFEQDMKDAIRCLEDAL